MESLNDDVFVPIPTGDPSGARSDRRDSLLLSATLFENGNDTAWQVRVRNLSAGGLMVEHRTLFPRGTPVEIELRGVGKVAGRIAWTVDDRIGIAFDEPIDPILVRKPVDSTGKDPAWPPR